jgi:hypothetical protein
MLKARVDLPPPDYTKSLAKVYGESMLSISKATKKLLFQHEFDPSDNPHQLPSWVPDYNKPFHSSVSAREGYFYSSSRGSSVCFLDTSYTGRLNTGAIIVDYISRTGLEFPASDGVALATPL